MAIQPNNLHLLTKKGISGQDAKVDEVLSNPEGDLAKLYSRGEEIYSIKVKKAYVEACLFCSDDTEYISNLLEIPQDIIEVYRDFFFDVRGWDKLTKLDHIDSIRSEREQEKLLKLWALNHGLTFIAWRLGQYVNLSPVQGLQELFSIAMYRAKESMYAASTSETGKESMRWAKQATEIARLLKIWVMDSGAAKRDLELAIREVVPDFKGLDSVVDPDFIKQELESLGVVLEAPSNTDKD